MTSKIRKSLFLVAYALVHWAATMAVVMVALGAAMSGFEPGTKAVSPACFRVLDALGTVMMFPMNVLLRPSSAPGLWGHLVFFTNGVFWGLVLLAVWHLARVVGFAGARRELP